jgi:hypothetical protein
MNAPGEAAASWRAVWAPRLVGEGPVIKTLGLLVIDHLMEGERRTSFAFDLFRKCLHHFGAGSVEVELGHRVCWCGVYCVKKFSREFVESKSSLAEEAIYVFLCPCHRR